MQSAALEVRTDSEMPTTTKRSAPIDPLLADRLLDLLSSDDAFRQLFQLSPQAALRSIGYEQRSSPNGPLLHGLGLNHTPEPFSLCEIGQLASKEAIREARMALKETLVQGLAYNTPTLEAANVGARLKRPPPGNSPA